MLRACCAIIFLLGLCPGVLATNSGSRAASTAEPISLPAPEEAKKPSWVPPGFEDLLQPQTTLVDVYYGGAYLMSTMATFTPSSIKFDHPNDIVARIPDILDSEKVARALATDMPTNSELACLKKNETGCGSIETQFVDVIFDEGRFRADLFIAPQLLSVRPASKSKFLPPSSAGVSLLNVTSASVNGESGVSANYNIGDSTTLAYKETRLFAVSNITSTDHFTVDTLALQREINGHQFQAGIFRSSPGNTVFITQADYEGISIASSLNTRQDLDQSSGSSLQVFLDSRSRVDILKDGRLISTGVYDTGNQIIDTSQLPGGAYDITLRIRDASGHVREETRFYIKTNQLPPLDQPLYFLDVGELVQRQPGLTLAKGTGERFARAGLSKRLTPDFGGTLGMLHDQDGSLLETGIFKLGRQYDFRLHYGFGTDHSHGLSLSSRARFGSLIFDVNARKIWADGPSSVTGIRITQTSMDLTIPFGRTLMDLTSRYNRRDTGTDRNVGLRVEFPTYSFGNRLFDSSLQVTRDNGDLLVLIGFRLSLRSPHWQQQITARAYHDEPPGLPSSNGAITNLSSTWNDGNLLLSDVTATLRASDERNNRTLESDLDVVSSLGHTNVQTVYSLDNHRVDYGANFSTSEVINGNTIALGGRSQAQSALVLNLDGDAEDAYFDVRVNKMLRGSASVGRRTIIGLPPFDTYHVELVPHGKNIVDFNNNPKTATLYPGNVVTLKWEMTRVVIAFGRIIGADGKPIENALIKGVLGLATTDDSGLFQAEIRSNTKGLEVKTRKISCTVTLPRYDGSRQVVMLGDLKCM